MTHGKSSQNKIGMTFPPRFIKGEEPSRLMACTYEEHIKQSIRALLLTGHRERVMRRDFGSGANAYLFENISATTASLIQHEIKAAIERYEPRVELAGVTVKGSQSPGVLSVEISYRILSTDTADQLAVDIRR